MGTVYIGMGANLGQPERTLGLATEAMRAWPEVRSLVRSSLYRTAPVGPVEQPEFVNAAARLEIDLSPEELLDRLQALERDHGRVRDRRWGPRTLDLDILFVDCAEHRSDRLTIPHPELHRRGFVLAPLAELDPDLRHPALGRTMKDLYDDWRAASRDPDGEVQPLEPPCD